jgi:hypothetical protein
LPYIGYFQLINAVDEFVVYDNIQFCKGGWIRRNRILVNGRDYFISLPIQHASGYLDIYDRQLAPSFTSDCQKFLRRIEAAYRKAPYFSVTMPVLEQCFLCNETNLFAFIRYSLENICDYLRIKTRFSISSTLNVDRNLKNKGRVIAICQSLSADHYINAIGGMDLYNKEEFALRGIRLSFLRPKPIVYAQFDNDFVPNLSIIDVMMFNDLDHINNMLGAYDLV